MGTVTPIISQNDKKDYRAFVLDNGLKVLLIHDPEKKGVSEDLESLPDSDGMSDGEEGESHEGTDESECDDEDEEMDEDVPIEETKIRAKEGEKLAAASLSIKVGGFQDPEDLPGFSHFLEHMVFMGSEKYKSENEFDTFVKKHGGSSNAHTCCEETVFVFDIQPKHFEGALDIFAQFFIHPLMLKDSMERELKAVDSEFEMALPSDSVRKEQILQSIVLPGHPLGKFMWGNSTSICLPDDLDRLRLNDRLQEYRRQYYIANRMNLVVQSNHSLDELEAHVRRIFSEVPSGPTPPGVDYSHLSPPFDVPEFNKIFRVAPVKDLTELELRWALPPMLAKYRTKPLQYISHLTGHEGEGSLMSYLRRKLWALELESGTDEDNDTVFNATYSEFTVRITLSDDGFKHLEDVIEATVSYIALVRETGPEERLFREIQMIDETSFKFLEESTPYDNVETLASSMHRYPPEEYISGAHLLTEYDPQSIRDSLNYLTPERMNIMVLHKDYAQNGFTDRKEKWVGACFKVEDIPSQLMERLKNAPRNSEFFIPKPNPFIAKDFTVNTPENPVKHPVKLVSNNSGTLWFKQDHLFNVPKASLGVYMMSPIATCSHRNSAALDMLITALHQDIVEELYPARLAQLDYSLSAGDRGLIVKASGFNDKIDVLVDTILAHLTTLEERIAVGFFEVLHRQTKKKYKNNLFKPSTLAKDIRLSLLIKGRSLLTDKLKAIDGLSREIFIQYISDLRSSIYIQALYQGNLLPSRAMEMFKQVQCRIYCSLSMEQAVPKYLVHEIPHGETCVRFLGFNPTDSNCVTVNYYQAGKYDLNDSCVLEMLLWLMEEPAFNQLRTQEQLGYHVGTSVLQTHGMMGFSVSVYYQIFKFTPEHVNSRVEAFLLSFDEFIGSLTPDDFQAHLTSLIKNKEKPDVSLDEEVTRHWDEIVRGEFKFDRLENEIAILKTVTLEQVRTYFRQNIAFAGNTKFRKMGFEIVGRNETDRATEDGTEFELCLLEGKESQRFVKDVRSFQTSLPVLEH